MEFWNGFFQGRVLYYNSCTAFPTTIFCPNFFLLRVFSLFVFFCKVNLSNEACNWVFILLRQIWKVFSGFVGFISGYTDSDFEPVFCESRRARGFNLIQFNRSSHGINSKCENAQETFLINDLIWSLQRSLNVESLIIQSGFILYDFIIQQTNSYSDGNAPTPSSCRLSFFLVVSRTFRFCYKIFILSFFFCYFLLSRRLSDFIFKVVSYPNGKSIRKTYKREGKQGWLQHFDNKPWIFIIRVFFPLWIGIPLSYVFISDKNNSNKIILPLLYERHTSFQPHRINFDSTSTCTTVGCLSLG